MRWTCTPNFSVVNKGIIQIGDFQMNEEISSVHYFEKDLELPPQTFHNFRIVSLIKSKQIHASDFELTCMSRDIFKGRFPTIETLLTKPI